MSERSVTHGSFTVERVYPHPRERVFEAFARPEALREWYVEGEGWEVESFHMDFRVGGLQTSSFRFRGGPRIENHTIYQDIVSDERIIYSYAMRVGGERISASLATVEFRRVTEGTNVVFTEQAAFLDGYDGLEDRRNGTSGLLVQLGRWLD